MKDLYNTIDTYSNCFQCMVRAVAEYYKSDYQMIYYNVWYSGRAYDIKRIETVNEKFWYKDYLESANLLEKFHGIECRYYYKEELKNIRIFITEAIKSGILGIFIDSYYCEWMTSYNNIHNHHFVIILDIDDKGNAKCIDHTCDSKMIVLANIENIEKYIEAFVIFDKHECNPNISLYKEYIKIYLDTATQYIGICDPEYISKNFERITNYSNDMFKIINLDDFPVINGLNSLTKRAYSASICIEYMFKKLSESNSGICTRLIESSKLLDKYKRHVIKHLIMKQTVDTEYTYKIFADIYKINCEIIEMLNNMLKYD